MLLSRKGKTFEDVIGVLKGKTQALVVCVVKQAADISCSGRTSRHDRL